jgi:hypothetical protein
MVKKRKKIEHLSAALSAERRPGTDSDVTSRLPGVLVWLSTVHGPGRLLTNAISETAVNPISEVGHDTSNVPASDTNMRDLIHLP